MAAYKRASDRCARKKLCSPGRPSAWRQENHRRFWQAIAQGRTSEEAVVEAGVSTPLGPRWFRSSGRMPPTHLAPDAPQPTGRFLSFCERAEIAILLAQGATLRSIARKLERSPSTISREAPRNAATRGGVLDYRASAAQWRAERAAQRPRPGKLAVNRALRKYVEERLAGHVTNAEGHSFAGPKVVWRKRRAVLQQSRRWSTPWSPEQIAHRLRIDYPDDPAMRISHEAIYQSLYIQGRGALRRELTACLRSGRTIRVPCERMRCRSKPFVGDAIMISERPPKSRTELFQGTGRAI